jgi:hypothetical protein
MCPFCITINLEPFVDLVPNYAFVAVLALVIGLPIYLASLFRTKRREQKRRSLLSPEERAAEDEHRRLCREILEGKHPLSESEMRLSPDERP